MRKRRRLVSVAVAIFGLATILGLGTLCSRRQSTDVAGGSSPTPSARGELLEFGLYEDDLPARTGFIWRPSRVVERPPDSGLVMFGWMTKLVIATNGDVWRGRAPNHHSNYEFEKVGAIEPAVRSAKFALTDVASQAPEGRGPGPVCNDCPRLVVAFERDAQRIDLAIHGSAPSQREGPEVDALVRWVYAVFREVERHVSEGGL